MIISKCHWINVHDGIPSVNKYENTMKTAAGGLYAFIFVYNSVKTVKSVKSYTLRHFVGTRTTASVADRQLLCCPGKMKRFQLRF